MQRSKKQFSWSELFSNETGKTSSTAFCGVVICVAGTLTFILGCFDKMWVTKSLDVINQSIMFVGIGAALMGVRKVVDSKNPIDPNQFPQEDPNQMINS
jgi:hypothetical protein